MCFGGQQPSVDYSKPDKALMAQQQQQMAAYAQQMQAQSDAYAANIADQIAQLTSETERMQSQFDQELAAQQAAADAAVGAYTTSSQEGELTANAQTTKVKKKQEDALSTLKISSGSLPATGGAGLNIGV